jgi:hypothetical protein
MNPIKSNRDLAEMCLKFSWHRQKRISITSCCMIYGGDIPHQATFGIPQYDEMYITFKNIFGTDCTFDNQNQRFGSDRTPASESGGVSSVRQ